MSDTPRTDSQKWFYTAGEPTSRAQRELNGFQVRADFAGNLERELNAALSDLAQLRIWKEQQLEVEATGDLHKLADLLGALPGDRVRKFVCEQVPKVLAERDAALARVKELEQESRDVPLCANHAQIWFTDRRFKQGDCWFCELERQLTEARKDSEVYHDALVSIGEYWNRDQNEASMADACWYAVHTAADALNAARKENK